MTLRFLNMFFLGMIVLASCRQAPSDQEIAMREKAVERREQRMTQVEEDYRTLLKMRDSLHASVLVGADTMTEGLHIHEWPEDIQGDWNSRMVCRASRCGTYVIGDQRNELWRFYNDSTGSYVQVINNDEYVRLYEGEYDGQKITLNTVSDRDTNISVSRRVQLDDITPNIMKGTLVFTGQNNCEAMFSVELTPRAK